MILCLSTSFYTFMITFVKTLSYPTLPNRGDAFGYVTHLLRQEIDPPSDAHACIFIPCGRSVLYSPSRRVAETISCLSGIRESSESLREIAFDVSRFIDERVWRSKGSAAVRDAFKEAFVTDTLIQKRSVLFTEIDMLLKRIRDEHIDVVVSHSFRLKLIETYIRTKGKIVEHPDLIHRYLLSDQKTYPFGGSFSVSEEQINFL